jgi:hypothetical protein
LANAELIKVIVHIFYFSNEAINKNERGEESYV